MSWIYCCLFSFTYLVYAMELNKTSSAFEINLGTLFAIYDRGPDETCDKEKMSKSSLEVGLATKLIKAYSYLGCVCVYHWVINF